MLQQSELRCEQVNVCAECAECPSGKKCDSVRQPLRDYSGIRFTSDGFDCALPVSIDSHSHCAYGCLYCFSDNLYQHVEGVSRGVGQTSLKSIENLFSGECKQFDLMRAALKYGKGKYPCAVQLGAINDPCDTIEQNQGWLLKFLRLMGKYNQPVRMSTKGRLLQRKDYIEAMAERPELLWVAFSIISVDDDMLAKIDRTAPSATERLKTMKAVTSVGCSASLRFRPILPGVSDATKDHPTGYRELIERAAEAGARAVSCEVAFAPGIANAHVKKRWEALSNIVGTDFLELYAKFGKRVNCMRPPYQWTEEIMHGIAEVTRACGMTLAVSDPVWKQLNDYGCCCGMPPDDPVFGNWQRENATNALVVARDEQRVVTAADGVPGWSYAARQAGICNLGVGPKVAYKQRHGTWSEILLKSWNGLDSDRGVLHYFQGALRPVGLDSDGNQTYRYEGLERQHKHFNHWRVD